MAPGPAVRPLDPGRSGSDGRRPCFGGTERLQTGWTGLIADVIRRRYGVVPSVSEIARLIDLQARP
jgi:hypothetical protein